MGVIKEYRVRDQTVRIDLDSDSVPEGGRNHELWRVESYDSKEPDTIQWIDTFPKRGDVIYDIGANIGQYSLYAALRLDRDVTVLAFEPEALNYAKLNRNIVVNGLVGVVIPHALAVSETTAIDRFFAQKFSPGAALHTLGRPVTQGEKAFDAQNIQGVMGVSLDDLTDRFGLPFPNHIKVDVDGIEERIVEGAANTLEDPRLKSVLIEVYMFRSAADNIKEVFLSKRFELSNADEINYSEGIVQNLIFARPTR